jgi:hypothetical protein
MSEPHIHVATAGRLREIANALDDPGGPKAVDWSRIRELLAALLTTYGPVLFPIILSLLTGQPEKRPAD